MKKRDAANQLNRLGGYPDVHQAPEFNGLSFDPFSFKQDGVAWPEVNVRGCQVADGLVVTMVVVVIDKRPLQGAVCLSLHFP